MRVTPDHAEVYTEAPESGSKVALDEALGYEARARAAQYGLRGADAVYDEAFTTRPNS